MPMFVISHVSALATAPEPTFPAVSIAFCPVPPVSAIARPLSAEHYRRIIPVGDYF
jgi:hypothetical protein